MVLLGYLEILFVKVENQNGDEIKEEKYVFERKIKID